MDLTPFSVPEPNRGTPPGGPEFVGKLGMTAVQLRDYVSQLEAERVSALQTELGQVDAYMADLEEELELCRTLYVISAVTEIATLRGELFGAQIG